MQARYPGAENVQMGGVFAAESEFDRWLVRQPNVCECGTSVELLQWETPNDFRTSPWCPSCSEYRGDIFVIVPV